MTNSRSALIAALICAGGVLSPLSATAPASGAASSPSPSASDGWSQVPRAARDPIAAALGRDGVTLAKNGGLTQSRLTASNGLASDEFASSVAVSGTTVVVGAPSHQVGSNGNQGAAYVFTRPASGWKNATQTAQLLASDGGAADIFGSSVAISGNTIVVGAFNQPEGAFAQQGAVYVFTKPATGWRNTSHFTAELTDSGGAAYENLGQQVAMSGATIAAGAPALEVDGHDSQGAVYVFTKPAAGWTSEHQTAVLTSTSGGANDAFGFGLALSGNTIVVGAPYHSSDTGLGYVFVKPAGGWINATQNRKLKGSDTTTGDHFGRSVAIAGNTIVAGAPEHGAGAAYVFEKPSGGWGSSADGVLGDTAELTATDGTAGDELGSAVETSGGAVLAGAPEHKVGQNPAQGAVYSFIEPSSGWESASQPAALVATDGAANDLLGASLAADSTTIAVGAYGWMSARGAVDVFAPPAPALTKVKQLHKSWTLGKKAAKTNPKHKPKGGTEFDFTLNQAAKFSLRFREKAKHGHHEKSKGTLTGQAKSGKNKVWFDGKIGHGKTLSSGHCKATISAKDANGTSAKKTLHFTTRNKK